ncbi:MAG: class I SAM-dependent methyltransferase [Nitrospinae bacterium]|nr:class I SAM-dependent methyltransferase [Nitrospinota bacterium]
MTSKANLDAKTIEGFGDEWSRFDQSELSDQERNAIFESYFSIFPWHELPEAAKGMDVGCGSGRWAKLVAPRVGHLYCIDPSNALNVARKNLAPNNNCEFYQATVDAMPIENSSLDFGYSLGVLHHIPDTQGGIEACVKKLKPGAPFLIYLYYAFDNKPGWFSFFWRLSDTLRKIISRFPYGLRYFVSQIFAVLVYFPMAKIAWVLEKIGSKVDNFPLSAYRNLSFYTMRTDALDRFGTRLEKRFTRKQIQNMMEKSGLERIKFSSNVPFWCAVGYRRNNATKNN